ncbi:actin-like ATPase domain-containing protein [Aspergillus sclerotioniger CBS 115572]|uniref:Actin-like ATPase domain-containing protein n=1 Tax=Aspergillus sclerotioniger CBS 115572 TaxID=1450535 RepID=A0A317WRT2_9EURO|nr:actin-like ATPase domain-containing protein [Aspergillus sclerotioniger CBS 115572]PWY88715.1 actin-like ATPase domain-containing protein [Aspergillus sclerotioniger CBS 115572]
MAPSGQHRTYGSLTSSPVLSFLIIPFLVFFLSFPALAAAAGSAVLGIDVGTEYLKATLVKPGIPLEIVLTKDSKRKESAAVAFKPTREADALFPERFYGGDALALAARYPDDVYSNLKSLLGVPFDEESEVIKNYHARYPALRLEEAPGDRGTVGLRSNRLGEAEKKDAFLVEEILAMQLKQIKANADSLAGKGSDITDAVITYPSFYTAAEKRSLELAAELAGLNVDAFISDNLAVGLNYATSRTFPSVSDGQKPEYHIIYDMGAGSTTASVIRFQSRAVKDVGRFNKTVQEVQVLGTGWDKTLGGDALNDLIVQDMIATLIEDKNLKDRVGAADIQAHGKTMARLWKDAEKARQVLSANTETGAAFESLYEEDLTFKYRVTRAKFEELAEQHIARVGKPLEQALEAAGLQLSDIDSVILHGGAIRTPFVQKELERVCGSANKVRTSVNADEAAVFGAAFKGAALSPSFRVKDIRASDASGYAVLLKWTSESKERQQKLFTPTSQVGPEKQVTVKNLDDFEFSFYHQIPTDGGVVESPILGVKTQNLTASVAKLQEEFGCSSANITTKFAIRLSPVDGLPEVASGSVSCEVESAKKGSVVEDVKGFFGLGKKDEQVPLGEEGEPSESITLEPEEPQAATTSSADDASATASSKESKKNTPQTKLESISISFISSPLGVPAPTADEFARIQSRLTAFDASDYDRILREEALNELESFIYRSRDLVDDEEFAKVVKPEQLTTLQERASAASDWLYGDGDDAKTAEFREKLKSLKEIVNPALKRKKENAERPAHVDLLQRVLKNAESVLDVMKQQIQQDEDVHSSSIAASSSSSTTVSETSTTSTESPSADPSVDLDEDPYATSSTTTQTASATTTPKPSGPKYSIFQPYDLTSLSKTYESTNTWFETQLALQEQLTETDDPALTVAELDTRIKELERILNRIYDKMGAAAAKSGKDQSKKTNNNNNKSKETKKDKESDKKTKAKEEQKKANVKDEL